MTMDIFSHFEEIKPIESHGIPQVVLSALIEPAEKSLTTREQYLKKMADLKRGIAATTQISQTSPARVTRNVLGLETETRTFKAVILEEDFVFI